MLSFSTMWAQQPRFEDMDVFRDIVASFGYDAIEVSHSTDERGLETLLRTGPIPVSSLHAPTPKLKLPDGRLNGDANLADPDEAKRKVAIQHTLRTIEYAAGAGLPFVVVHLGGVGDAMTEWERDLRRLYNKGVHDGEEVEELKEACRRHRATGLDQCLDASRRSLKELIRVASAHGVALGLENRLHHHEFPHPAEAEYLLADYGNDVAGYWHDVGHCEVQARIGMIDRGSWFPLLTPRTIGCHLHNVDGLADHRAPGNGDVDWSYIAAGIPASALHVFEVDQGQPDDKVAAGIAFLRDRKVVE
jgi:sugar phosphate isomerase/epimerase